MDEWTRERYPGVTSEKLESERRAPLRKHRPIAGRWRDHRGVRICDCGSAWDASIHRVPEVDEEAHRVESRKVGER